jgi:hypothetical protein
MSVPTVPTTPAATPVTGPAPAGLAAPATGPQGDPRGQVPGPRRRRSRVVLVVVLSVVALAAAIVTAIVVAVLAFGHASVSVPAATVGQKLTDQFGAPITCTQDLPATVGATTVCTGTDDQGSHHVLVTATSVDGTQVDFTGTVQD